MADDDDEIAESFESVKIEREDDGRIAIVFGETAYHLSEDDCMVFARGLQAVAANNPPEVVVHFEDDERSAHLEYV